MKILIYSQYFWPENFLVNNLVIELKKKNKVDVVTGLPNYPNGKLFEGYTLLRKNDEYYKNVKITRSLLIPRGNSNYINLVLNYISFFFFSFFKLLFLKNKNEYDLCIVYAPSPLISLLPIFLLKKKFKFKIYLWLQDLWPLVIENKTKINFLKKFIKFLCKLIYDKSDKILIQSQDYEKYLCEEFNIYKNKIIFFPNWSPNENKISYMPNNHSKTKIAYLGNIGYAQNFENLIKIMKKNKLENFEFNFFGDGRFKKKFIKLINQNNIKNIHLHSFKSQKDIKKIIINFDALFLSLSNEYSHTIPAKFQYYLSLGMPIIAIIDGYVNKLINSKNIGFACCEGEEKKFIDNAIKFSSLSIEAKINIAENSFKLYQETFSKNKIIKDLYAIK